MKNKKWVLALIVVLLLAVASGGNFTQSVIGGSKPTTIYEPNFASGRCQLASSDTAIGTVDSSTGRQIGSTWSGFTTVVEIQCKANTDKCKAFTVQNGAGSIYRARCPLDAVISSKDDLKARCQNYDGIGTTLFSLPYYIGEYDFNVNTDYFTNKEKLVLVHGGKPNVGDFVTTIKADIYDLQGTQGNGLTTTASGTCNLKYLNQNIDISQKDIEKMKANGELSGFEDVLFRKSFNYIAGMRQALDSVNVVQRNGEWVYIQSVGKVCPLERTKAGLTYADCREPVSAPEIICIPYQPAGNQQCSQDGTKWVDKLTCNWYGAGLPAGTVKVGNQLCEATCSSGEIKYVNCKDIQSCSEGSVFNYEQNKCVPIGGIDLPITTGCKKDADCDDKKFWTTDTCEKTGLIIKSPEGQCKHDDKTGYYLAIGGAVLLGFMFLTSAYVLSGKRKKR